MDPFDEFDRYFQARLRNLFPNDLWSFPSFSALEPSRSSSGQNQQQLSTTSNSQRTQPFVSTRLELVEAPQAFKIHVELPGVKKEDIKLHVDGDVLTVEAERKESIVKDDERRHYSERRYGVIKRQVALPPSADTKTVSAKFEDGVLVVEMGKNLENGETRKAINIK